MDPKIEPVVLANTKFSIDLLKELCEVNTGNVLFSPLSISSALGLVCLGGQPDTNETYSQMYTTLHFGTMKIMYSILYEELNKDVTDRSLYLVNLMFGENTVKFNDDFLKKCEDWCFASLMNVDFKKSPDAARKEINDWVKNNTGDHIENLLAEKAVTKDTILGLISALFFKDKWASAFTRVPANKDKTVDWPMMSQTNKFPLGTIRHRPNPDPEAQILEIPYANKDLSMLIILPKQSDGLQKLVESITYENLMEWTEPDNMILTDVDVKIPIFTMQEKYDLNDALKSLGMVDVFEKRKLSGIAPEELCLSKVVHKSFVVVNEEGTEAGGGSGGVLQGPRCMKSQASFMADHPFLFFLRHNPTNSIIFWGRFVAPP
ncbi:leukocyte elastase inhibitor-like [Pseudorasbora parva]|uniref:leukocyte elastase inhibitor-like n=1 Tax=Pseudorasbora parva TaxID=51549 RepID=UPI00351E1B09